jgi:ribosomal protein S18 acetylase RimI-like enzyme
MRNREAMSNAFTMPLQITIRPCTEADLPNLEWFGMFTEHREIIRSAFDRQASGDTEMLVADANNFPVGQVWIDYARKRDKNCSLLWAVRVFPALQRTGIGTRLIGAAENMIRQRAVAWVEVEVERNNSKARHFYERLGYRFTSTASDSYSYITPDGVPVTIPLDLWILHKELSAAPEIDCSESVRSGRVSAGADQDATLR